MDDSVLTLAFAAGVLPARPTAPWNPDDPIETWLAIGRQNPWIVQAWDPPFDRSSFDETASIEQLRQRVADVSWSVGKAFHIGTLCFIQQVDSGDEWLAIREGQAFDSLSLRAMITHGTFDDTLGRILAATPEVCRALAY